jgi:YD repeat-containing protein
VTAITPSSSPAGSIAYVYREDGHAVTFNLMKAGLPIAMSPYDAAAVWVADADEAETLTRSVDGAGNTTGWTYYSASDDSYEQYDAAGHIVSATSRMGVSQTLTYDGQGRLTAVTDAFGRSLTLTYVNTPGITANYIATMTDPAGAVYQYGYDAIGNLQTVTYPGGAVRTYVYNESALTSGTNQPFRLTGIIDELGNRYASFGYDALGNAISTEHAGGVQKYSVTTVSGDQINGPSIINTVADPLGVSRNYAFDIVLGVPRFKGVDQPCNHCGGLNHASVSLDSAGNALSRSDFNGNKTCYQYNSRNLETARVEGAASTDTCSTVLTTLPSRADVRKISTQWNATWRVPAKVAEPNRITSYVYNGDIVGGSAVNCAPTSALVNGLPIAALCSKTVQETTDSTGQQGLSATLTGTSRSWSYTYDAYGQLLTQTDPNNKTATIAYYAANDPDTGKRGNVQTITNAVGHVTTWTSYDLNGRPLSLTDPNGTVTTLTYHARGWLTSKSVGGETTTYGYDDAGQRHRVTLPDSS